MYKLSSPLVTREVTVKEAEEKFISINNFEGQRELNLWKVRGYADSMLDGTMRPVEIAVATLPNGTKVLMNGQHVCHAIVVTGRPFRATISYWTCETDEDAWKLFATFDVHASRTEGQIMKAARGLLGDSRLCELPLRILSAAGSALVIVGDKGKPQFEAKPRDKKLKPAAVAAHVDETLWLARFKDFNHLVRVGVFAAMIATRRRNKAKADEFWGQVADGIGIKAKDQPAYKLRERLRGGNKGGKNGRRQHFAAYCASVCWWNSFITGDKRHIVKVAAMTEPPEVIGTPAQPARATQSHRAAVAVDLLPLGNSKHGKNTRLGQLVATA